MTREEAQNLLNNSRPKGSNAYSLMLNEALDMAIEALKKEHWTSISEGYPPIEDEYKYFLVVDAKGMITIQQLYFTINIERRPYFSGMVNPVAWMPLPLP